MVAISCIELSASASAMLQGIDSALHADFSENPEDAYEKMESEVFKKIHYSRCELLVVDLYKQITE